MAKGLFTSTEEISFQYNYIQGNAPKAYDPNTRRNPARTKCISQKNKGKKIFKAVIGRTR